MDEDRKSTALKALQELSGTMVTSTATLPAISTRTCCGAGKMEAQGIDLYIYSSGSVAAQKLLFGYSDEGDITHLFSGYFDTHIGAKREVQSYQNIAAQTGIAPSQILFLSDIHQELDAAEQAGFRTLQLIRGDDDGASHHHQVHQFDEINPEQILHERINHLFR